MQNKQKLRTLDDYRRASQSDTPCSGFLLDREFYRCKETQYHSIQEHSVYVDRILGIHVNEVEEALKQEAIDLDPEGCVESWSGALHSGALTWVGLSPGQLQTPYSEILELLEAIELDGGAMVVDLGAGYGRIGLVLDNLYPDCRFVGFEMAMERVNAGNESYARLGLEQRAKLYQQDIAAEDFELPVSDYYFIYDFGNASDMKAVLSKIEERADNREKFTVLARGRGINSLIRRSAPWLCARTRQIGNTIAYYYA